MRLALWFLGLFGVAVALALFAGNNQGTVTLFLPPYRLDLSLNFVVVIAIVLFLLVHLALRALAALFAMPGHARSWRIQHQERSMHQALVDALSHLVAGRFVRARKAAETVLVREAALIRSGEKLPYASRLRALSHLLAAESAQALQDKTARATHFDQALMEASQGDAQGSREGVQLRAARWAIEDRDAQGALTWLDSLPMGASRRTLALRLRLKAARMARQTQLALETGRLLAKHRAFSELSAHSILRGLTLELVQTAHDVDQLRSIWNKLEAGERAFPEVATEAAHRLLQAGGSAELARAWLLPVWERMVAQTDALNDAQRINLVGAVEATFASGTLDTAWMTRIEQAQMMQPGDAALQYLAGVACMRLQLWGKAQQWLAQAAPRLKHVELERKAWLAMAKLAEQRGDADACTQAWQKAARLTIS